MKIIFARHGESQANILHTISNRELPHSLTSEGRKQAVSLADRLKIFPIAIIYTSPVPRAVETGRIIAERLGIEVMEADALREFDCGVIEGRSDEAAWRQWKELFDAWQIYHCYEQHIEGGESFLEVKQRFVPFIERLINEYASTPAEILCISHGGLYSTMLPLVLQNVNQALITNYGFDYTSCIVAEQVKTGLICTKWNEHSLIDE